MRRLVLATAMVGMAFGAEAADMPDLPILRGSMVSVPARTWDGWYVGGQGSYSAMAADFSNGNPLLSNMIPSSAILPQPASIFTGLVPKTTTQGGGFGGFVGRNWQWDDLVFGVEANYNYFGTLSTATTGTNSLQTINPFGQANPNVDSIYTVTLTGRSAVELKDAIQFRARTGWATGNFLPYIFGAVVVGRMDVSRTVTSTVTRRDDTTNAGVVTPGPTLAVPALTQTLIEQKIDQFVAGWSGGLGLEYCVWGGLFLRAEWDYTKFLAVKNTVVQANNLRFGIGYKF
jgi:outer membrane immunogenic protein